MHPTKAELILKHGLRCMCCGKETNLKDIQWHHIKPKYVSKTWLELPDDSYDNGALLCANCHHEIHKYWWWDDRYQLITDIILDNKEKPAS